MEPEVFAEFLRRQGHRVIQTESCFWYNAQPGFYFYFPYHRLIRPTGHELRRLLWGGFCIGMRFFAPPNKFGKKSYLIICSDKNYNIMSVEAKTARRQTRRGLEHFQIRQMDLDEAAARGGALDRDTLIRQGRLTPRRDQKEWSSYCLAMRDLKGFEAWGAFSREALASLLIGFQMEDHFTILHQCSGTAFLHLYPNNALVFHVTQVKLASNGVEAVSYGPQSLDAPESLDTFKFRMGFERRAMRQRIIFHPVVRPFINRFTHLAVRSVSRAKTSSDTWRKLEGIIRFYRESN